MSVEDGKYSSALKFAVEAFKARFIAYNPFASNHVLQCYVLDSLRDAFILHGSFPILDQMVEAVRFLSVM